MSVVRVSTGLRIYRSQVQYPTKENLQLAGLLCSPGCEAVCSVNLAPCSGFRHCRQNMMRSSGNPGIRSVQKFSAMPSPGENIVLAALARVR